MAEIRDKGEIPLVAPDSKPAGGIDPQTGYIWCAFLDLNAHAAAVWYQPVGWLPTVYYGGVNLVGWVGFSHDGHFKLLGKTWEENGGNLGVPGKHFVVVDLGPVPR